MTEMTLPSVGDFGLDQRRVESNTDHESALRDEILQAFYS
jgi:hypothetical protein